MSKILLIGLNHKTAPVEIRECLAFSADEAVAALHALQRDAAISEVILFSTCNRVEVLLTAPDPDRALDAANRFLSTAKGVSHDQFQDHLYVYRDDDAVRHMFRVASSLDSMMVGEPQILGQIKEAYRIATQQGTTGVVLNRLLHRSFFVAKRIRTQTGIGDHAVSISYAAIELGRKIFGTLERKKVLLIGAGEMAELAVEHLIRNRSGAIFVANRTFPRGVALAERFQGTAIRFEEITEYLKQVDIIISSTGAVGFILQPDAVKPVMRSRRNRPLFFIDIAVPRDVDPAINRIDNAYVYDIDDLKNVIDENIKDRNTEAVKGERIVDEAVIRFRAWRDGLEVIPTIVSLRKRMEGIADAEIKRTFQALSPVTEKDREAIQRMKTALINKLMHHPTIFLKGEESQENLPLYLDVTRKLFHLDD